MPLMIGGAIAIWLSHPAPIVLTGIGALLIVRAARAPSARAVRVTLATLLVWGLSAVTLYLAHARHVAKSDLLQSYWASSYAPFPPATSQDWRWYLDSVVDLMQQCGLSPWIGSLALIAGIAALVASRRWSFLLLAIVPWLTGYALAAAKVYPFGDRLILFLVPGVALLIAAGAMVPAELAQRAARVGSPRWRLAALLAVQVAVVPTLHAEALHRARKLWQRPYHKSDMRELTQRLREQRRPGDLVYASTRAWAPYEYYSLTDAEAPRCLWGLGAMRSLRKVSAARVWLLFLTGAAHAEDQRQQALAMMDARGHREQEWKRNSTWLYLYRMEPSALVDPGPAAERR
jgi:hypothetical protein